MDVQTELYLEELSDKIPEANAGTQTDAFLDRPPSPFYVPQKMGVDVATQVFEGDLFVFDYEVETVVGGSCWEDTGTSPDGVHGRSRAGDVAETPAGL